MRINKKTEPVRHLDNMLVTTSYQMETMLYNTAAEISLYISLRFHSAFLSTTSPLQVDPSPHVLKPSLLSSLIVIQQYIIMTENVCNRQVRHILEARAMYLCMRFKIKLLKNIYLCRVYFIFDFLPCSMGIA